MATAALALLLAPAALAGQDVEARARPGLAPPAAYFQLRQSDPRAFQFTGEAVGRASTTSRGVVTLPVVLALFLDSDDPHITRDEIDRSLFTGPAPRGTVSEAYTEISRGALEVRGDVFPWVRTPYTLAQVVDSTAGLGSPMDNYVGEYFTAALDSLDATVDWAAYDNDGPDGIANSGDDDGYVDVVTFEYLEIAASCGGTDTAIWPHRWSMQSQTGSPYVSDDPSAQDSVGTVRINDYITQSVADCSGLVVQDASTIAHEFGHALGLPDYYHPTGSDIGPEGRRWIMGCWALMAGGSWGCGRIGESRGAFGPTHMMAQSKFQLGWLEYVDPGEVWNEEIVLDPVETSGRALRIPMGDQGTEFLIAEYRAAYGFDAQLPADGVIMYKLDTEAARRPDPSSSDPYYLSLLEQDGNFGLVRNHHEGGDRGVAADAWGVGGPSRPLNAETIPALLLSSGARTPVMVHQVTVEGGQARVVLSTGRTPRLVEPGAPLEVPKIKSFLRSVRIAGGTGPYTTDGTVPDGVILTTASDELIIGGSLVDEGPYQLTMSVADALGSVSNEVVVEISAPGEWTASLQALLQSFLSSDAEPLTPGELDYLDAVGNANGSYDVGDLRKWLREQGAGPS